MTDVNFINMQNTFKCCPISPNYTYSSCELRLLTYSVLKSHQCSSQDQVPGASQSVFVTHSQISLVIGIAFVHSFVHFTCLQSSVMHITFTLKMSCRDTLIINTLGSFGQAYFSPVSTKRKRYNVISIGCDCVFADTGRNHPLPKLPIISSFLILSIFAQEIAFTAGMIIHRNQTYMVANLI